MKSAALFALLAVLLFADVRGQRDAPGRCKCRDGGINAVRPNRVQKLEVIPASPSCHNIEIIVTLEDGAKRCLNPQSNFAKTYIERVIKSTAKAKVTTEMDSPSAATTSPVSVPTTAVKKAATQV
ncbi:hypothetical protein ACEWY4_011781 [Coilia grayii]|uniref:Chemokine interleukin-8-like domain-containing protein n=1 Tax=Coilia grayii TaxID=363190 RepID=A0ABD1JZ66_9TELE